MLIQFPMHNYPLFMNMMSTVIYVPLSFAYIIPVQIFGDAISKDQTDIPKYKFAGTLLWPCLFTIDLMISHINYQ